MAGKDIMLDPRAGIRKAGAMPPLMALLKEVVEVGRLPALRPAHAADCPKVPHKKHSVWPLLRALTGQCDRDQGCKEVESPK